MLACPSRVCHGGKVGGGGGGGDVGITPVHLSGFCQDDIITQPFVTKLGMVVHHHGLECHEAITGLEFSRSRSQQGLM